MIPHSEYLTASAATFVLVLTRISGVFLVSPFFAAPAIPRRVRVLLASTIALAITTLHGPRTLPPIGNLAQLVVLMAREAALGLILAVAVLISFQAIQLAGQLITHLGGLSVGDLFDPNTNSSVPIMSQLLYWVALAIFLVVGGHRQVMRALLDLFAVYPPGYVELPDDALSGVVALVGSSFEAAWRVASPIAVALLLAMVVLGLLGRTLPQLNILAVGLGTNALITLAGLMVTGGMVVWVFQTHHEQVMESVEAWLRLGSTVAASP